MELNAKIDLQGELVKTPLKAQQKIWLALENDIGISALQMVKGVKILTPVGVTGNLRKSIRHNIIKTTGLIKAIIFSTQSHALPVETGTKAHNVPIAPLKLWAKRKGMPEGAAWAIRKRIAGEVKGKPGGTSWHARFQRPEIRTWGYRMFQRGFDKTLPRVKKLILIGWERSLKRYK